MKALQIEAWALNGVRRMAAGQPDEDSLDEVKAEVDPAYRRAQVRS